MLMLNPTGVQSVETLHQGLSLGHCGWEEPPEQKVGVQVEEHGGQAQDGGHVGTGKGGGTLLQ